MMHRIMNCVLISVVLGLGLILYCRAGLPLMCSESANTQHTRTLTHRVRRVGQDGEVKRRMR